MNKTINNSNDSNNNKRNTMYGKSNRKNTKKLKSTSPIRVLVKCGWSGARLTVPTDPTPINSKSTLLEIILRLESGLPPALFTNDSNASLVCLRKIVQQSDWDTTTLRQMLDGDDGSAGVVLTLDLGSGSGGNNGVHQPSNPVKKAIDSAASSLNIKPQVVQSTAPSAMQIDGRSPTTAPPTTTSVPPSTNEQPMDIDGDAPPTPTINKVVTPEDAWKHILQSNFDATTKDCLNTLLKIIDNIISRPNEPKVRSIRCANAAIEKKVGRCTGGFDFLYSIGFIPKYPALGGQTPETLVLIPENESKETLLMGRKVLIDSAVNDLNMNGDDLPPVPKVKEAALPASTLAPPPSSTSTSSSRPNNNSRGPTSQFNVYKTHSHNIQSAAMGAPDPYTEAGMSSTERQLQNLQSKKERLEREMQDIESDRGLVAYRAGCGPAPIETSAGGGGGGKTDSSLVAARMKRMEEERKKREEGGFTTKAMRDLEKMKKAKVYSHAQIRVNFPDGSNLHAKFLPREKVSSIRSVIKSAFQPSLVESLDFDLYVAPPRRLLDNTKRLDEEELVPAAKIHISWKVGGSPSGSYLRDELFSGGSNTAAFPDAKPIVKQKQSVAASAKANGGTNNSGGGGPSKEEMLMQKMLGKKPGLFGGKKSSSGDNKDDTKKGGGKPKWFKG